MPTYINPTDHDVNQPGLKLAPGETGARMDDKYLLDSGELEIHVDGPSPWEVKNPDGEGLVTDLRFYRQIIVLNHSGKDITITANLSDQAVPVPSGHSWPIMNDRLVDKLTIDGEGTLSSVYVVCIKRGS